MTSAMEAAVPGCDSTGNSTVSGGDHEVLLFVIARTFELCRAGLCLLILESDLIAHQSQLLLQHFVEVCDLVGREDKELDENQAQVEQAE